MPNVGFQIGPEPPMSPLAAKLKGLIAGRQQGLETFSQFALGEEAARNQAGRQQQQTMLQHQLGMQEQGAQQDFTRETEKRQHYLTLVDFLNQAPDDYKPQLLDQFKQSPEFMQAHEQWGGGIPLESYTTPTQGAVQAQEEHKLKMEAGTTALEQQKQTFPLQLDAMKEELAQAKELRAPALRDAIAKSSMAELQLALMTDQIAELPKERQAEQLQQFGEMLNALEKSLAAEVDSIAKTESDENNRAAYGYAKSKDFYAWLNKRRAAVSALQAKIETMRADYNTKVLAMFSGTAAAAGGEDYRNRRNKVNAE